MCTRWPIDHRPSDNWVMGRNEQIALAEIDVSSREIVQLGQNVGKNVYREERPDAALDHSNRLHDAVAALERARGDVAQREDDPRVFGLQQNAMQRIEAAKHAAEQAIRAAAY